MIVSPSGEEGSLRVHQDAKLYSALLDEGKEVHYDLNSARHAWLQVIRGTIELNGIVLNQGDGAAISSENRLMLVAQQSSEFLLFDLP